jgi:hypothetical protein
MTYCYERKLVLKEKTKEVGANIDAHRLKIQGRGYLKFLPKYLGKSRL